MSKITERSVSWIRIGIIAFALNPTFWIRSHCPKSPTNNYGKNFTKLNIDGIVVIFKSFSKFIGKILLLVVIWAS